MPRVFVSIGSNIEREANIRAAVQGLRDRYGGIVLSPVYESEAVGFAGEDFYNLVAAFDSDAPVEAVAAHLRRLEEQRGRRRQGPRFGPRTLDVDLLLYGDLVREAPAPRLPREEITRYAFVLRPLADIAGAMRHPVDGRSFVTLWQELDLGEQRLKPVSLAL